MSVPASVLIVGESTAGCAAARELRALGYSGPVTIVGADDNGSYSRPALSKQILNDATADDTVGYQLKGLDVAVVRSPATALDTDNRIVTTAYGHQLWYGALIVATGADSRRLARPGQAGEIVLRTLEDAQRLRARLDSATSAVVVGAGFLGMEVASACAARDIPTTVVDVDPPLERILGPYLSQQISERAAPHGVEFLRASDPVALSGSPIDGILFADGSTLHADLVVTCAGERPCTEWLTGTPIADEGGVGIDEFCATADPHVFAAGDVTYRRAHGTFPRYRAPFWSNAVAQGKVTAASVLGKSPAAPAWDDYFWTEVLGLSIKVVGPLPLKGAPTVLDGQIADGSALLQWHNEEQTATVVAYGMKKSVGKLLSIARASTAAT